MQMQPRTHHQYLQVKTAKLLNLLTKWLHISAGTLQLINRRLIGCHISFTRSAGFNRSQYIGSAGKAQI